MCEIDFIEITQQQKSLRKFQREFCTTDLVVCGVSIFLRYFFARFVPEKKKGSLKYDCIRLIKSQLDLFSVSVIIIVHNDVYKIDTRLDVKRPFVSDELSNNIRFMIRIKNDVRDNNSIYVEH